jgi:HEAT repeat protein
MKPLFVASVGAILLASASAMADDLGKALQEATFASVDAVLQSPDARTAANIAAAQRELSNPTPAIRQLAAYALSELDPDRAKQEVPALVEALQHPEPLVRARLALAFAKMGPAGRAAVPGLIEQLRDENPRCRAGAARALGSMGADAASAVPTLAGLLKDSEPPVRVIASMSLGKLGPLAKEAAPALRVAQRSDADADVRAAAATALEDVDPPVALILATLHDPDATRRLWAVSRLIADGAAARQAIPQLTDLVTRDVDAGVRAGAAMALGKLGAEGRSASPALIQALSDSIARVRATAALALGLLGSGVPGSGVALAKAVSDPDPVVNDAAATALGNLGPAAEEAVPVLVGLLGAKDPTLRCRAVNVLARVGPSARLATAALLKMLNDDSPELRRDACRALVSVGPQTQVPIPVLIECLNTTQDELTGPIRAWACLCVAAIGPPAIDTLPALMDALRDREANVRAAAALALAKLGPAAVPSLIGGLDHVAPEVRVGSAFALGGMGTAARRGIDPLLRAVRDEDAQVSMAAVVALASIARGLQLQLDVQALPTLVNIQTRLQEAKATAPGSRDAAQWQVAETQVAEAVKALRQLKQGPLHRLLDNPWLATLAGVAFVFGGLFLVSLLLLWLRPLTLLTLSDKLRNLPQIQLPIGFASVTLSIRDFLLLSFFEHHPRVLDAWIARQKETYRRNFEAKPSVQEHPVFAAAPITMDGEEVPEPSAKDFARLFISERLCVLICGPAGAGKSSLACCLARWAIEPDRAGRLCDHVMLPVLLEHGLQGGLEASGPGHRALTEAVRGQVQAMLPDAPPIPESLITAMLRQRRLLIIVDCPAQAADGMLAALRPDVADFPVHALVVVSRREESLGGVPRIVVQPHFDQSVSRAA